MSPPYLGPLTDAIWKRNDDKPPALNCEWHQVTRTPGDTIFLWAASARYKGACFSWMDTIVNLSEGEEHPSVVVKTPGEHIERLLSPLAHAGRIRILQALYDGPRSASELIEATESRGGSLYHHLRELQYAAYVTEKDGGYALTNLGRQILVTVAAIASRIVVDRGEQGLGVTAEINEA